MNKRRQIVYTILGIVCVGGLFCAAMIFPRYYNVLYDKKTLNQITYMDVSLNMYTSYESFLEKLYTIARCEANGVVLQAVKVNEIETGMDNEKLTDIVQEELKTLFKSGVLTKKVKVSKDKLSLREMYTIYTTDREESIKGINYWKIVYDGEYYSMTILLDVEYHKIYDILVKSNDVNYEYVRIQDMILGAVCGEWMHGMAEYYGFKAEQWYFDDLDESNMSLYPPGHSFCAVTEVEDVLLKMGQRAELDEYGYWILSQGIHLEEKIQF